LPIKLLPEDEIKDTFLISAAPDDIAIVALDENYREFLDTAKEENIACPIFLISPEPTIVVQDIEQYNALVLDLKKMGSTAVKNILRLFVSRAAHQVDALVPEIAIEPGTENRALIKPLVDQPAIREILGHIQKKALPVIVAFDILENGKPVTARGVCNVKEVLGQTLALDRFRQSLLLQGFKKGMSIKIVFSFRQKNLEAIVSIQEATGRGILITIPDRLFSTKEIRIQPNQNRPLSLFILMPNEPTKSLEVIDISPKGIGFIFTRDLPINNVYGFTIMLPEPQAIVVAPGIIRFKKESDNGIRYGAEIRPHPWDEESIAKYLMRRETEILSLLRNQ